MNNTPSSTRFHCARHATLCIGLIVFTAFFGAVPHLCAAGDAKKSKKSAAQEIQQYHYLQKLLSIEDVSTSPMQRIKSVVVHGTVAAGIGLAVGCVYAVGAYWMSPSDSLHSLQQRPEGRTNGEKEETVDARGLPPGAPENAQQTEEGGDLLEFLINEEREVSDLVDQSLSSIQNLNNLSPVQGAVESTLRRDLRITPFILNTRRGSGFIRIFKELMSKRCIALMCLVSTTAFFVVRYLLKRELTPYCDSFNRLMAHWPQHKNFVPQEFQELFDGMHEGYNKNGGRVLFDEHHATMIMQMVDWKILQVMWGEK